MIGLTDTTHTLELVTAAALSTDYYVTYADTTASAHTPGTAQGNVNTATTTTIVSAPGASTYRGIKLLTLVNRGTSRQTVTIQKDVSGVNYVIYSAALDPNAVLIYSPESGFVVYDGAGRAMPGFPYANVGSTYDIPHVVSGATAGDVQYAWYFYGKDQGTLPAWAPGTPGVNGRTTDGTTAADQGCLPLRACPSGLRRYLAKAYMNATYSDPLIIYDVLWVNSGLVVTTTTAQAITTPTLPARDNNGATNGEGCQIGLLFVAAATNAAAISNSTVTYTNSAGTGSRTASLRAVAQSQIPATPVIGTIVWFDLQAGDTGVQSIQSITLGTSLVTGTISLLIARPVATFMGFTSSVWVLAETGTFPEPGAWIPDGACLLLGRQCANTSAANQLNGGFFTFVHK